MSHLTSSRSPRWSLLAAPLAGVLVLAGCSGGGDSNGDPEAGAGFSLMVSQANDAETFYQETVDKFTEATGIEIEVIPYPADAYNTQVTTQLQAGNAADKMILITVTGLPLTVCTLVEDDFLLPLGVTSADLITDGSEVQYQVDGETYGQPTSLTPTGFVYNAAAAEAAGIDEYPATYDDMLAACSTARDAGLSFTVLAGAVPNTGLMAQIISATRVYADPDWNEQRAAGDVTFADSDGWKETLEDILEMNESGCFQDGAAGGTFDSITAGLGGATALTAAVPGNAATSISEAPAWSSQSAPSARRPSERLPARVRQLRVGFNAKSTRPSRNRSRPSSIGPQRPRRPSSSPTSPAPCRSSARRPRTCSRRTRPSATCSSRAFTGSPTPDGRTPPCTTPSASECRAC